jgi:ureidoglycolate hydrolase
LRRNRRLPSIHPIIHEGSEVNGRRKFRGRRTSALYRSRKKQAGGTAPAWSPCFTRIARHRRVTQCLGSLGGKEWLIGVAPPGDLDDDARPRVEDIAAFRVPGDRLIKLHVATWHAGPHFVHDECLFINLENLDTNRRDFHGVPLPVECRYRL